MGVLRPSVAVGYFMDGQLCGRGSRYKVRDQYLEWGTFDGTDEESLESGMKEYTAKHHSFKGEFKSDGTYFGKMTWENGFVYEGEWKWDSFDGEVPIGL